MLAVTRTQPVAHLSKHYAPTLRPEHITSSPHILNSFKFLLRGAFVRQSAAGIFSILPNGQRVLDKIQNIIDYEMLAIGASKVSLPTLQQAGLWQKSGRFQSTGSELFTLQDRRKADLVIAPTHEEEVTAMIANEIKSEKDLPIRIYQTGKKFRDEARPRAGLLRCREFLMKDLYTFDATLESAKDTYSQVRQAYDNIFQRIGIPYKAIAADSGNIGGSLSHEYQYLAQAGEDTIVHCSNCNYSANSEVAISAPLASMLDEDDVKINFFESHAANSLVGVVTLKAASINQVKLAKCSTNLKPLTTSSNLDLEAYNSFSVLLDNHCATLDTSTLHEFISSQLATLVPSSARSSSPNEISPISIWASPPTFEIVDVHTVQSGDQCPSCKSPLQSSNAIEVGHTFLLGTKYSQALECTFVDKANKKQHVQMGCYGIGVSRILAAVAECRVDDKGIRWPSSIAPFKVCIMANEETVAKTEAIRELVKSCSSDTAVASDDILVDDRYTLSFGQRLKEAELVGYPVTIVIGKSWEKSGQFEISSRVEGTKTFSDLDDLPLALKSLLART